MVSRHNFLMPRMADNKIFTWHVFRFLELYAVGMLIFRPNEAVMQQEYFPVKSRNV